MRHFLMIMKRCEIVHTIFEYFALYVALKSYYLAWYSINNQIHQKCLIWILIVCSKLLQQTFEFSRQKWQHHKCDSKYRFAHPLPLICDINKENLLKTLPCTQLPSRGTQPGTPCIYSIIGYNRGISDKTGLCRIKSGLYRIKSIFIE